VSNCHQIHAQPAEEQKENCVSTCHGIREWRERIPKFLSKMITGHEMIVCVYDSGTERQSISSAFRMRQDKFCQM
jgi:hypothetical protein